MRPLRRRVPAQVRVAAVDLGTNTTRLLVADVEDGRVDEVHRETRITRLGEGVDARRRLLPVPIARVRNALSDYRRTLERLGAERTLAVATSAVRDAENGEAFLGEVEWSYGFATRLVSGDEEAELTRRGVEPKPGTLVVDIGGGSTELIVDDFHASLDIGSVRYTERFVHTDPPTSEELDECARAAHVARRTRSRDGAARDRCRGHGDDARRARPRPRRTTTASACTVTGSRPPELARSSSGSPRSHSPSGASCRRSSPSARR